MWARSFTVRAILAVGFLIGFYLAAIAIALCLLALPVLEVEAAGRLHVKFAIICVMAAGMILWSLVPSREKFEAPGPRITMEDHPRLFALIQEVATAMGMAMPAEVYLVPEVNAFVTQRGGILGFGGRRVMGIGVPLLAALNVSQLRAIISHEFGHYAGGETSLSGTIYATRAAMLRTVQNLGAGGGRLLKLPFEMMFKGFVAITHAISRQQELLADQWAVKLAGLEAHRSTLRLVGLHANAYDLFLRLEVAPLTSLNVIPKNVFEGYRKFIGSSTFVAVVPDIEARLKEEKTSRYDTHPATEERVRFAESLGLAELTMDPTPAFNLLTQSGCVEESFSEHLVGKDWMPISWDDVPRVRVQLWNRSATRLQARLPGLRVGSIPRYLLEAEARDALAEAVSPELVGNRSDERDSRVLSTVAQGLNAYVSSLLCAHGWTCQSAPGEPPKLHRDGQALDVLEQIKSALNSHTTPDVLMAALRESGIEDDAIWTISDEQRAEALQPRCTVVLEESKGHVTVTGPLGVMVIPQCCALCCGPLEYTLEATFQIGGRYQSDGEVTMGVPLCQAHRKKGLKAWDVKAIKRKTGIITLRIPHIAYGRLFPRVNA